MRFTSLICTVFLFGSSVLTKEKLSAKVVRTVRIDFQMRFTSSIYGVLLFGSFVLTQEYTYSRFHYGARLIDDQLYYFEMMLDTYQKFDFSPDIRSLIENKDQLPEDQMKKRISLHESCVRKVRDGFLYAVKKSNALTANVFYVFFSGVNKTQELYDWEVNLRSGEALQITMALKQFLYLEMPKYYIELGKNMSIDFTEEEIEENRKMVRDAEEENKQNNLDLFKHVGIDIP